MKTWRERIAEARARGEFTERDVSDAEGSWSKCAVGEQRALMPNVILMTDTCRPVDEQLFRLGNVMEGFGKAVAEQDFARAETLLDRIEDRALQLKRDAHA